MVQALPFEALFEALEDAVVVFEPGRAGRGPRVIEVNDAYCALVGRTRDGIVGKPLSGLLAGVQADDRHTLKEALDGASPAEVQVGVSGRPMRLRLTPLDDRLWAGILRDLTPLRDLKASLVTRALRDGLTGLWNRRAWTEQAQTQFDTSTRYLRPLSVVALDLDHFKRVNDAYGHATGDAVLQAVCGACRGAIRRSDLLGRIGGEELAVIAPETGLAGASTLGVRICNAVRRVRVSTDRGPLQVTISVGVAERSVVDDDLAALMARADAALYRAKAEGRDRVVVA